jgi:hypothetical protein
MSGGGITLMTEEQLTRLLKRLAVVTREPRTLSAYSTCAPVSGFTVSTSTNVNILGPNKYRWAIGFSVIQAGPVQISFSNTDSAQSAGIAVYGSQSPWIVTWNDIGAAILGAINASSAAVNSRITWQEFITPLPLDGTGAFLI